MEKNILSQFTSQFAEASLPSLVESFNAQVGNRGFNSARAAHDHALIDELVRGHRIFPGDIDKKQKQDKPLEENVYCRT